MPKIILTKHSSEFEYPIESEKTAFFIKTIAINELNQSNVNWIESLNQFRLYIELSYTVYPAIHSENMDERKLTFPIDLKANPDQKTPIFRINQLIKNESFTIGLSNEVKSYQKFNIILQNFSEANFSFEIDLEVR